MKRIATGILACWFGTGLTAQEFVGTNSISSILRRVPAAELPAQTAALVRQSILRDRNASAADIVTAAVRINPAATPLILGAVARAAPERAALAAGAAAKREPTQAEEIARATAGSAPSRAAEIVAAVCRVVPREYKSVSTAVARLAPGSTKGILKAVAAARPDLQPFIEKQIEDPNRALPSVSRCLELAEAARSRANVGGVPAGGAGTAAAEQVGPLPTESLVPKPPHDNGHHGGRNYARP